MEVIVERQTSMEPERRYKTKPVWLYQVNDLSPPQACFTSEDAEPIPQKMIAADGTVTTLPDLVPTPTVADLALVPLDLPTDVDDDPALRVELLGADPQTRQLLGLLSSGTNGVPRRGFNVESVVTAGRESRTQSGLSFTSRGDYLFETEALLQPSPCGSGNVNLGVVVGNAGTFSLCVQLGFGENVSSMAGTPVVLSDHKRPLMLGVYGPFQTATKALKFTSVMESSPDNTPIVDSISMKTTNGSSAYWFELKPRSPKP